MNFQSSKKPRQSKLKAIELFPSQFLRGKAENMYSLVLERPIACSLALLALVLVVIIFSMAVSDSKRSKIASSTLQNVAVENQSSPESTPVPDNILKWQKQLEVTPEPDSLSLSTIEKILPGQDYKPGTLQIPNGWKAEYSTSSSEIPENDSFSSNEPVSGVKFIKISTDTVSTLRPVAQGQLTAPLDQQDIPSPVGSKALAAKLLGNKLYIIYKSIDVVDGLGDNTDLTIGCLDINTQQACQTSSGEFPSYLSSQAGSSIGSGVKDISTAMSMQYGFDDKTSRMYIPAQKGNQYGVNCIDLAHQQNCGFTALQSGTTAAPSQAAGKNPALISGFAQVGSKLYGNAAYNNGNGNRADDFMQITCFDISLNSGNGGLCEGYTGEVNSVIPSYYTSEHGNEYYTPSQNKVIGDKYYFLLNYDQGNTKPNTLSGYSQTLFANRLVCYNIVTQTPCQGWPKQKLEHTFGFPPLYQFVYGAIVNTQDTLGLVAPSQLILTKNTAGTDQALCSLNGFSASVDPGFACFNPESSANTTSTDRPPGFLPVSWLNAPWLPTFNSTQIDKDSTSKVYSSLELPATNILNTPQRSAKICYDWKTAGPCNGFRFPFYNYEIDKPLSKDIAFLEDGGCIVGVGEANYAYSFDASTGETPCRKTSNIVDISTQDVAAGSYCGTEANQPAGSPYRKLVLDSVSKYDFEYINITIKDSAGAELENFQNINIRDIGSLDLSSIPATTSNESLTVEVTTNLLNESPWGNLEDNSAKNIPRVSIVLNRDPVKYCYQTQVLGPPEQFCNISKVQTSSNISLIADSVASETVSLSTKEVFQQPSQQCFKALSLSANSTSLSVRPGDSVSHNVVLKNDSNINAYGLGIVTGARLEVTLPSVTSFVSASEGGVLENNKVVWAAQTVNPQESKQYTVTVSILESVAQNTSPNIFVQKAEAASNDQNFSSTVFYLNDSNETSIDNYNSSFTYISNTPTNPAPDPATPAPQDTEAPSVPAGLIGSILSPTQIKLDWSASQDNVATVSYQVFRDGNLVANVVTNDYLDESLSSGTDYVFTVRAVDFAGNISGPSNSVSIKTPVPDPATIDDALVPTDRPADTTFRGGGADRGTIDSQQSSGSRLLSLLLPEQVVQAIRLVPEQTARTIPYILILLLVIVAFIYARQAWVQLNLARRYREIESRYFSTLEANKNFISLISHYLNTPVTIIQASIDLAVVQKSLSEQNAKELSLVITTLAQDIKKLISESQTVDNNVSKNIKSVDKLKSSKLMVSLAVVIPTIVCLLALGFANFIFTQSDKYNLSGWMLFGQLTAFSLTVIGLFSAYRSYSRNRLSRKVLGQQILLEADLSKRRIVFITASFHRLENDFAKVKHLSRNISKSSSASKTFANGLKMFENVLTKFAGLIEYAKPLEVLPRPILVEPVISGYLGYSKEIVASKKITINTKIQPGLKVGLSSQALRQLVSSVLDNSIKFSSEKSLIEVSLATNKNNVILSVKDNGIGIDGVKLKQLMAPFSRATDVLKFDYEGIGLSLYLNKVLLEQVGGSLEIVSKIDTGTTVNIIMPSHKT